MRLALIQILAFVMLCPVANAQVLKSGPFKGVNIGVLSKSQQDIIIQASTDFDLVSVGKKPKFAKPDTKSPVPADGGTNFYIGKGYKLTIVQSLSSFGGPNEYLHGIIYGPVIEFDDIFAPGNERTISDLRFYTAEQLAALGKHIKRSEKRRH